MLIIQMPQMGSSRRKSSVLRWESSLIGRMTSSADLNPFSTCLSFLRKGSLSFLLSRRLLASSTSSRFPFLPDSLGPSGSFSPSSSFSIEELAFDFELSSSESTGMIPSASDSLMMLPC